ncbi:MAG: hypothetical protein H6Q72_753 [Firmicutes bacterium]|nr:hypothetical protein [Bacillota bacterium]
MAGRLAIDFGNTYTVAAYWRESSHQAETLYLPGVTRPVTGGAGKRVFAAPSLVAYDQETQAWLIGLEAVESDCAEKTFHDLQYGVVTGKLIKQLTKSGLLTNQDLAKEYLAAFITKSSQVLGLGSEAMLAFAMPLAVCSSDLAWRRYRHWLEGTAAKAGFCRLDLIEQPWAAAWGAGMQLKPEDLFIIFDISAGYVETAVVQVRPEAGEGGSSRHVRVISYNAAWLGAEEPAAALTDTIRQVLRTATVKGYPADSLAGIIITGWVIPSDLLAVIQDGFTGIACYEREPMAAAACGAAMLSGGIAGCGCIQHSYTVRYWGKDGYHYRELVPQGLFYPSDDPVGELIIKASYDGQQEFAILVYRNQEQCINADNPLLLTLEQPSFAQQPVIRINAVLDGAGHLLITAYDIKSDVIIVENIAIAKLV